MDFLKKLLVMSALLLPSYSALAWGCVVGSYGHCIWGFDKKEPDHLHLIDPKAFLEFCDKNNIYCSSHSNGYNTIQGRYLNDEVFMLANNSFGGPDYILDSKDQAEQFAQDFKTISNNPDTVFFVKNDAHPKRNVVAIAYKEMTREGMEEIKVLTLPNEWKITGDEYAYLPPDM